MSSVPPGGGGVDAPTSTRRAPAARIEGLDALRGIAALMVVVYHYTVRYPELFPDADAPSFQLTWGAEGVRLFFLISGFVISMSIMGIHRSMDFVVSRASRLYPAFWVAVLITFTVTTAVDLDGREVSVVDMLLNLTMVPRFLGAEYVDGAYWTLAVELMFYASMLVAWRLGLLRDRVLPALLVAAVLVAIAASAVGLDPATGAPEAHLFAAGMALSALQRGVGGRPVLLLVVVATPLVDVWHRGLDVGIRTACFIAVLVVATTWSPRFLSARPLVWFGGLTYTLYLLHQNIGYALMEGLDLDPDLEVVLTIVLVTLMALALSTVVERPALRAARAAYRRRVSSAPSPVADGRRGEPRPGSSPGVQPVAER